MTSGTPPRMAAWLESAWLARYLDRQLEGEELAWFEAYLLDKPELVEAVEVDNMFCAALHHDPRQKDELEQTGRARHPRMLSLAFAASVAIGVGLGWMTQASVATRVKIIANPGRIVLDTTRGREMRPTLDPAARGSDYILIEIAIPESAEKVAIRLGSAELPLEPQSDGFASLVVPRAELPKQVRLAYTINGVEVFRDIALDKGE